MAVKTNKVEPVEPVEPVEQVEQVEQVERSNDVLISVRNDHTAMVAGIAPGSTGEVKYGIFKSSIGLVEI